MKKFGLADFSHGLLVSCLTCVPYLATSHILRSWPGILLKYY
jgi:hypothetical protein